MPTITFDELMTPIPVETFVQQSLDVAVDVGLPVTAWQELSTARELIYIDSTSCAVLSAAQIPAVKGGLLDYAEAGWLTLLAEQVYDVDRILASAATGTMVLTNSGDSPHTIAAGDIRVLNEDSESTYTNTSGGTLSIGGTLALEFRADVDGTASDVTSASGLSMITTLDGVAVSYGSDMLGQDDELDPALRQRCRDALGRASPNGPAAAYDYFSKSSLRPDGTNVGVTRTRRIESNGTVRVYVADADGVITGGDVAYIQSTVDLNCVPTGFTAIIESAATLAVPLSIALTRAPGTTDEQAEVESRVTAAIAEYFSTIPVGGDDAASFRGIYISTLITIIRVAAGPGVVNAVVTLPAADVALAVNQVPIIIGAPSYGWD
jgi:phage-related baseplate assembly protein